MNKKGGLLTNIIVLVVVFFVGMFAGYTVLTKIFGEEVADTLSPEIEISEEDLIERCGVDEVKEVVCGGDVGLLGSEGEIGIEGLGTEIENEGNNKEQSDKVIEDYEELNN